MPKATLEDRVKKLERRMSDLEGQVGFLIPIVRQVHLDLLEFKEQVEHRSEAIDDKFTRKIDGLNTKFIGLNTKFDGLGAKFDRLAVEVGRLDTKMLRFEAKIDALPRTIAKIVADTRKQE
jgi:polyhydroxyalkanoate synthesis regulator phasin